MPVKNASAAARRKARKRSNRAAFARAMAAHGVGRKMAAKVAQAVVTVAEAETAKHSVLARLYGDRKITFEQLQAGSQFRSDFQASRDVRTAQLNPDRVSGGTGGFPAERLTRQVEALQRYRRAADMLFTHALAVQEAIVFVCIHDWLNQSNDRQFMASLKRGLDALAHHYGHRIERKPARYPQKMEHAFA